MTGCAAAAVMLATAVLLSPSPRRRLLPPSSRGRVHGPAVKAGVVALAALGTTVAAVAVPAVTVAAVLAAVIAGLRRRRRKRRRSRRSDGEALAAALETLIGELQVGAHPVRAFTAAAAESGGHLGAVLRSVAARAHLGSDVGSGLRAAGAASAVPVYWSRIAVCWDLAAEHGLPIAVLMRTAARDITDRQRFADRTDAGLAGARATAAILAGLPVLGVALGELVGARPLGFLLGGGGWLLVAGAALICAGVVWSDRIIDRQAT